jgi:hypothetical protein
MKDIWEDDAEENILTYRLRSLKTYILNQTLLGWSNQAGCEGQGI